MSGGGARYVGVCQVGVWDNLHLVEEGMTMVTEKGGAGSGRVQSDPAPVASSYVESWSSYRAEPRRTVSLS